MSTSAEILALKRRNLHAVRSTVRADYLMQTAHNRGWARDTAQPLPAYPAPGAAPIEIVRYAVPAGMQGALTALAIVHVGAAGSFVDGSGDLLWHVLVNGAPVRGLENIYAQIGTLAQPQPMALLLTQNDVLQVLVEIPAGKVAPAGNSYARVSGWLDYGGQGIVPPPIGRAGSSASANAADSGTGTGTTSPTSPTSSPTLSPTPTSGTKITTTQTLLRPSTY